MKFIAVLAFAVVVNALSVRSGNQALEQAESQTLPPTPGFIGPLPTDFREMGRQELDRLPDFSDPSKHCTSVTNCACWDGLANKKCFRTHGDVNNCTGDKLFPDVSTPKCWALCREDSTCKFAYSEGSNCHLLESCKATRTPQNGGVQYMKLATASPTVQPTKFPTKLPTKLPTSQPTKFPTNQPTKFPTTKPTSQPTPPPTTPPPTAPTPAFSYEKVRRNHRCYDIAGGPDECPYMNYATGFPYYIVPAVATYDNSSRQLCAQKCFESPGCVSFSFNYHHGGASDYCFGCRARTYRFCGPGDSGEMVDSYSMIYPDGH